ncbi:MAG TPA: N-acetyl-gamma-glutamyl-phosphate reductase [Burkholderiales bacterium]|nr:N-acetyl-gamma-glutamyl-phosphate reductase [Burkholderiales bacterium]
MTSVGIVGARGYAGAELIRLIAGHPRLSLGFVSSRKRAGEAVAKYIPEAGDNLSYECLDAAAVVGKRADVVVLALPNGGSAPFVAALDESVIVIDLSADRRRDDAWYYGLPELTRARYRGQKRISNPGCYATAMQLALAPVKELLSGPAACFGVSGYSGAGTSQSERNDLDALRDNLIPYSLAGHGHEHEVMRHLGFPASLLSHVAPHFRGIALTVHLPLQNAMTSADLKIFYEEHYEGEALIRVLDEPPWVSRIAGKHHAEVGGFATTGLRAALVVTLDNLLKGAATQAMQNLNIALGYDELEGIPYE